MKLEEYKALVQQVRSLPDPSRVASYATAWGVVNDDPLTPHEQRKSDELMAKVRRLKRPWFHGGTAGRAVGDVLLPPRLTGANPRGHGEDHRNRMEYVFISSDRRDAINYASHNERCGVPSKVYTVEPEGEILPDRENLRLAILCLMDRGLSSKMNSRGMLMFSMFCCASARVLRVEDVPGEPIEVAA